MTLFAAGSGLGCAAIAGRTTAFVCVKLTKSTKAA
jgi:hypothetical protein